ncbi:DUF2059 domain-containing protein [Tropicimonas aquimaris]|uniref:DUF2059 domain-containing protein n=1 Tax=Tropicimonas aquimaris TaxID=914152 RepID=A0ABW3IUH3_9RHOB
MIPRPILSTLALCFLAFAAWAQTNEAPPRATPEERARLEPLMQALEMDALLGIMQDEGVDYAGDLESDMFPGRGGERWPEIVAGIFDVDRMADILEDELAADLPAWHLDPLIDFFTTEPGRKIVQLEISARQAMLDPGVEAAANEAMAVLLEEGGPRLDLLEDFAAANDLLEMNVVGALNANYAFYSGLNAAGAFGDFMGEEDMLRDVWSQEDEIRDETGTWLYSYLAMAYQPLTDAELKAYLELSRSEAGRSLNTHLFAAFDEMFRTISYDLGMAAARFMAGEDL